MDRFLEGRLEDDLVAEMEAHVEACEECFLRVAVGATDLPEPDRSSLYSRSNRGSRLSHGLTAKSLAQTTLADRGHHASESEWSRQSVGPYLVTGLLGMGGMSVVYRAKHQVTGREVAVKTVKMPFVASSLVMLRQEIEFLREAQHFAIVRVLDSDLMAEDPWYAMELFEGPTLQGFNQRLWNAEGAAPAAEQTTVDDRPSAAGGRLSEVLRTFANLCDPVAFCTPLEWSTATSSLPTSS